MSISFNKVIVAGNLTRDVEVHYTPNGTAVADVTLAVNERHKDAKGEYVEDVVWVDCTLWGKTAEIAAEYLSKGSPVLMDGRLKLDTWEKDGERRSKLKVVVNMMQMLGGKPSGGGAKSETTTNNEPVKDGANPLEDIAF